MVSQSEVLELAMMRDEHFGFAYNVVNLTVTRIPISRVGVCAQCYWMGCKHTL
jgi:hypothetical protein